MEELSKMMRQYLEIKEQYKDCIVFFRLGDFYEMFFEDAKIASSELQLTLTGRACGLSERAPMCGVPYHSYETYAAKLIKRGYKVAICEQTEDPKLTKDIVKREIVRVITPGTVIEGCMLEEEKNNYICSVYLTENKTGICFADISTGELSVTVLEDEKNKANVVCELAKFTPTEIVSNAALNKYKGVYVYIRDKLGCALDVFEEDTYSESDSILSIESVFEKSVVDLGISGNTEIILALGRLIGYLEVTQKASLNRLRSINFYDENQHMLLDLVARYNLELTSTMRTNSRKGSLLGVLDDTKTAMGKRLLKNYIEKPLVNSAIITKRLNAVSELSSDIIRLDNIRESLSKIYDLERMITRVVCKTILPKELVSLCETLMVLPEIKEQCANFKCSYLKEVYNEIDTLTDVSDLIIEAINPKANTLKDGNVIKKGYNYILDDYRDILHNVQDRLLDIETREREATGIKTLKTGYNKIFGYYIEITNMYKSQVPETYIRKQTLTNAERYINAELKEIENKMLDASTKVTTLEADLYNAVRDKVASYLDRIQKTATAIAKLDVFASLSSVANKNNYVCPTINANGVINIKEGRHPVVEKISSGGLFIPNDTFLDNKSRISIITGPNMAGKSTYMRQTALIVLMAHVGSFVPATSADIPITDAIFTRVGASDDLSAGQSTFMVEMSELSGILKNATKDSLLILDEIGRGTSTYDGMSIARAVLEYIGDAKKLGAKCMFATHYHELAVMEDERDCIKNYYVTVKKFNDDIIFLRKIARGHAEESFGIEVAKLAELPDSLIKRAREILAGMENGKEIEPKLKKSKTESTNDQTSFDLNYTNGIISKLQNISIDALTPIEALNILYELKKLAE